MSCWLAKIDSRSSPWVPVPGGDLLADLAVQLAEVLFDLAEVREQVLGQGGQLLEMVQCFRGRS